MSGGGRASPHKPSPSRKCTQMRGGTTWVLFCQESPKTDQEKNESSVSARCYLSAKEFGRLTYNSHPRLFGQLVFHPSLGYPAVGRKC